MVATSTLRNGSLRTGSMGRGGGGTGATVDPVVLNSGVAGVSSSLRFHMFVSSLGGGGASPQASAAHLVYGI
jgi:hypothetical protein